MFKGRFRTTLSKRQKRPKTTLLRLSEHLSNMFTSGRLREEKSVIRESMHTKLNKNTKRKLPKEFQAGKII